MSALWIAHVKVTDEEEYGKYLPLATEAVTSHGGVFIARGGRYLQMEGADRPRNVVARFPTLEDAEACYKSEVYQKALVHAFKGSERELVIVEEV